MEETISIFVCERCGKHIEAIDLISFRIGKSSQLEHHACRDCSTELFSNLLEGLVNGDARERLLRTGGEVDSRQSTPHPEKES